MPKKRPPTKIEVEQNLKAMKEGELRHLPQFDLLLKKGKKEEDPFKLPRIQVKSILPTGVDKKGD